MEEIKQIYNLPLIGDKAPEFSANTTMGRINFPLDYKGKWVILFSHPSDFTPVCTTEFMTFAKMFNDFKKINTQLLGLSIDSTSAHIAWVRKIKELQWKDIKHPDIQFPIIEDLTMNVAKKYGMIQPNASATHAVRAVFVIDPNATIRAIIYYPASLGRNFDELHRIVIALQTADSQKCATPADWRSGDDVIIPAPATVDGANERVKPQAGQYCLDWFLCFKKIGAKEQTKPNIVKQVQKKKSTAKKPTTKKAKPTTKK